MEQIIAKDADLLAVAAQQRCTGNDIPTTNTEARIRAIMEHPEAVSRWQLALILAVELPDLPTDAVVQILARCPRTQVNEAFDGLGGLVETIDTETLVEAVEQIGADIDGVDQPAAEEKPTRNCETSQRAPSERMGGVPDFAELLGLSQNDAELLEATWQAIQTPRDYTTPDTALVESLLQTLHRDGLITPTVIAEDIRRFHEDFADCRRIAVRMRAAEAAGVRGC